MTADTTPSPTKGPSLVDRLRATKGHAGIVKVCFEAASYITELEWERRSIIANIPMDYLKAHDVAGATGPTASLDLVGAMRAYSEARWRIIDRCKEAEARAEAAEANARRLEEALRPFAEAFHTLSSRWEAHETHWQDALHRPLTVGQLASAAEALKLTTKEADRGPE